MISYEPFWQTLKDRNMTSYTLVHKFGLSSHTVHRLRKNKGISTALINQLCTILECNVKDILNFVPDEVEEEQ